VSGADLLGVLVVGIAAGMASGLLGVGGGILFVPGLVLFLGESQLEAQATSLLAIVVVSTVGTWRQRAYGNVRLRDGAVIGALSLIGVLVGTVLANVLPERALELAFATVLLWFMVSLGRRALSPAEQARS
jgi:uncharacterized protein